MPESRGTVLNFQEFKLRKQESLKTGDFESNYHPVIERETHNVDMDLHIKNIKNSIHRINSLIAELKSLKQDNELQ